MCVYCVFVCVFVCVHVYTRVCVYLRVCISVCMCVYVGHTQSQHGVYIPVRPSISPYTHTFPCMSLTNTSIHTPS